MAFSHYVWNHQVKRTLHSLLLDTTRLSLSLSLQHVVAHHSFTNIEGADPDIATAEVVRLAWAHLSVITRVQRGGLASRESRQEQCVPR